MEKIILDVDAGLVNFCLGAISKRPYLFSPCWWRDHQYSIWHRVFPPELWGPYGPWGKINEEVESVVTTIEKAVVKAIDAIAGD